MGGHNSLGKKGILEMGHARQVCDFDRITTRADGGDDTDENFATSHSGERSASASCLSVCLSVLFLFYTPALINAQTRPGYVSGFLSDGRYSCVM